MSIIGRAGTVSLPAYDPPAVARSGLWKVSKPFGSHYDHKPLTQALQNGEHFFKLC